MLDNPKSLYFVSLGSIPSLSNRFFDSEVSRFRSYSQNNHTNRVVEFTDGPLKPPFCSMVRSLLQYGPNISLIKPSELFWLHVPRCDCAHIAVLRQVSLVFWDVNGIEFLSSRMNLSVSESCWVLKAPERSAWKYFTTQHYHNNLQYSYN